MDFQQLISEKNGSEIAYDAVGALLTSRGPSS